MLLNSGKLRNSRTKPTNTEPVSSFREPGANTVYSGGGITISQLIVTDVTGFNINGTVVSKTE